MRIGSDDSRTRACASHVPQGFPRRLRPHRSRAVAPCRPFTTKSSASRTDPHGDPGFSVTVTTGAREETWGFPRLDTRSNRCAMAPRHRMSPVRALSITRDASCLRRQRCMSLRASYFTIASQPLAAPVIHNLEHRIRQSITKSPTASTPRTLGSEMPLKNVLSVLFRQLVPSLPQSWGTKQMSRSPMADRVLHSPTHVHRSLPMDAQGSPEGPENTRGDWWRMADWKSPKHWMDQPHASVFIQLQCLPDRTFDYAIWGKQLHYVYIATNFPTFAPLQPRLTFRAPRKFTVGWMQSHPSRIDRVPDIALGGAGTSCNRLRRLERVNAHSSPSLDNQSSAPYRTPQYGVVYRCSH